MTNELTRPGQPREVEDYDIQWDDVFKTTEPNKKVRIGNYCQRVDPHPDGKHVILSIDEWETFHKWFRSLQKEVDQLKEQMKELQSKQGPRIL